MENERKEHGTLFYVRAVFIFAAALLAVFMIWAVTAKVILTHSLQGTWKLYAGGGVSGYVFHRDSVDKISDGQTDEAGLAWRISYALPSWYWKYGTALKINIGGREFGISLGLGGYTERQINSSRGLHAVLPWSFHLDYGEGSGGYIRVE